MAFRELFVRAAIDFKDQHQFIHIRSDDVEAEDRFLGLLKTAETISGSVYIVDFKSQKRYRL